MVDAWLARENSQVALELAAEMSHAQNSPSSDARQTQVSRILEKPMFQLPSGGSFMVTIALHLAMKYLPNASQFPCSSGGKLIPNINSKVSFFAEASCELVECD